MVHFLIRVCMGVALSPWSQAHAADGGETEITLTPEQRQICNRNRTTTGIANCVREYFAINSQEAREAEKAASEEGDRIRRQRELAALEPYNPALCTFEIYKVASKDANDEAVKIHILRETEVRNVVNEEKFKQAIATCRTTCEEVVNKMAANRHCVGRDDFQRMRGELVRLIESCSNPSTIGNETSNGAKSTENADARAALLEGTRVDTTSTSSFHTERCVQQTGGVSYCQASYNTGAGPSTRYFYRDSYGGAYETYQGATSDQTAARLTLHEAPTPQPRPERDPIVTEEPIVQSEVVERPKVETQEGANGGSNAGATTGSTNGSTTSGTNGVAPAVAQTTNGGSNGGTGGGSSGGSSGGMGGGTSGSSPFIATPFPSDASPSGSYTGSEISSGSSGGGGFGGGSSGGGSSGGSQNRPSSTSGSRSLKISPAVASAGGSTSGGMLTPTSSRMGASGGRSGAPGGSGAGDLPGAAFGSQFYNRAQGGPGGLAAKNAAAAAKRKKLGRKGSKLNECDGNVQCLLVAAGVSKEKFRKSKLRGRNDRDIASVQSAKWPNDVGRGLHDVLSHMSSYYNQIQLDHEGLIENNEQK